MKKFLAITSAIICCMGNEYPAKAGITEATQFVDNGLAKLSVTMEYIEQGDLDKACRWFIKAEQDFIKSYKAFPHSVTKEILEKAKQSINKNC
jgi:hypothetical protein